MSETLRLNHSKLLALGEQCQVTGIPATAVIEWASHSNGIKKVLYSLFFSLWLQLIRRFDGLF